MGAAAAGRACGACRSLLPSRHAAGGPHRTVDPLGRFRAARRRGARNHRGGRRLHPYRRDGRAFRAQPDHRPGGGEGAPALFDAALRRPPDDFSGRSLHRRLRRGRRRHHHRPSRGRAASPPHRAAGQIAGQEGRGVAQPGDAARGGRAGAGRYRPRAGDERQSRLRWAELHRLAARQAADAAPAPGRRRRTVDLEVDGGINAETAPAAIAAGADVLVAGTAGFAGGAAAYAANIRRLRGSS